MTHNPWFPLKTNGIALKNRYKIPSSKAVHRLRRRAIISVAMISVRINTFVSETVR